ncbi:hypothetical protein V2J09_020990 [Rumex salicifolius]
MVTSRTLTEVRHIPVLKKNLISLGTLHVNGFDYNKGVVMVMKGQITTGRIYRLIGSIIVGGAAAVVENMAANRERHVIKPSARFVYEDMVNYALVVVYHAKMKHIDVRFHKIRKLAASSEILLEKVHMSENRADMLTKPVTMDKFKHFLDLIHVFQC